MGWLKKHPSMVAVIAINVAWTLVALASSPARPIGPSLWHGEETPVERLEVALILVYMGAWSVIAWRLRARSRLPRLLAQLMIVQLFFMLGEELDFCHALRLGHRNVRMAAREVIPEILDTPLLSAYLLFFLAVPLVPLARVRAWLERAAPVRAEREDSWAVIVGILASVLVFLVVGDQVLGELHQVVVYAVLGIITVRIVRRTRAT